MTTTSLAMAVQAPHVNNANRIFRALKDQFGNTLDGSPDPGRTFSIPLSPTGTGNPTHWGAMATGSVAQVIHNILLAGFPTGINWSQFNLTQQQANQAWNAIAFDSKSGWEFRADWTAFMGRNNFRRIEVTEE